MIIIVLCILNIKKQRIVAFFWPYAKKTHSFFYNFYGISFKHLQNFVKFEVFVTEICKLGNVLVSHYTFIFIRDSIEK